MKLWRVALAYLKRGGRPLKTSQKQHTDKAAWGNVAASCYRLIKPRI